MAPEASPSSARPKAGAIYSGQRFGNERVAHLVCGSTNRALDHPGSNPVPSVFPCTKCVGMGISPIQKKKDRVQHEGIPVELVGNGECGGGLSRPRRAVEQHVRQLQATK
jgi:hypothetical protein